MNLLKHQFVEALDAAPSPTQQLSAVQPLVDAIRFETHTTQQWTRFVCTTCGRIGTWLIAPEKVRANATAHAKWHAEGSR